MLIGVDWGGTKIEAIAIADDGRPLARLREMTPRSDYEACLDTVAAVVSRVEAETGIRGSVGIGIPGSLDPRTRAAKGASSTWLNGRPVEADLRHKLGREVRVANDADCFAVSEAVDGAGAGHNVVFAVILGSGPPKLADETFSPCFYTPIVRAAHGDSSGVRGAAWLWR
jgi:fructokinase